MGLLADIIKEMPHAVVLQEKVATAEAKYAAADTENAILKDDLREANAAIAKLKKKVEELTQVDALHETEINILKLMPEFAHAQTLAIELQATATRVEHHLDRLCRMGYLQRISDPFDDDRFEHTAKAREYLAVNGLI